MKTSAMRKKYKKKQLSKGQKKIAKAAPPYDAITKADFITLKKNKKRSA